MPLGNIPFTLDICLRNISVTVDGASDKRFLGRPSPFTDGPKRGITAFLMVV